MDINLQCATLHLPANLSDATEFGIGFRSENLVGGSRKSEQVSRLTAVIVESDASVSKSFGNGLSFFFLVAWFAFCSAEK